MMFYLPSRNRRNGIAMRPIWLRFVLFGLFLILTPLGAVAESTDESISVTDAGGTVVSLSRPAQRVVSLAPHITERNRVPSR